MNEETYKTSNNDDLSSKPWLFQPGNKMGKGRPKGSFSLKTFAKKYLQEMNDDEKIEFMRGLPKDVIWKMAEGNPETKTDLTSKGKSIVVISQEFQSKYAITPDSESGSDR